MFKMLKFRGGLAAGWAVAALLIQARVTASDHADPMSLNVLAPLRQAEANLTDLHAFVDGDRLVVSLCARRSLQPHEAQALDLAGYQFTIHFDFHARVETAAAPGTGDGATVARYGGLLPAPENIASEGRLTCRLERGGGSDRPDVVVVSAQATGFRHALESMARPSDGHPLPAQAIVLHAGIFDDPFIFPRFFRRNVVGMVYSIPLEALPVQGRPMLLWATSQLPNGEVIDHVGRSLRTQLPRFGYLNALPPADHRAAILQRHEQASLLTEITRTFISPLLAHRHYDIQPDVMIYDLGSPARFPNGRALHDDVAAALAEAGETLLFELSYAESRQYPRATTNDKPFRPRFPYLAPPWTPEEIAAAATDPNTPAAPDPGAIARPDFEAATWRRLFALAFFPLLAVTALALLARPGRLGAALILAAFLVTSVRLLVVLGPVDRHDAIQPHDRLLSLIAAAAVSFLLSLVAAYAWGRRRGTCSPAPATS